VIRRTIKRKTATTIRRRIEAAQAKVRAGEPHPVFSDPEYQRAQRTLEEFGVTQYEDVFQSRKRVFGWWRIYADAA
jgi:hypothetical protein